MSPHQLVAFAVAAFLIIVVPGPSVLFVVSRGVALGRRAALATVVGNTAGSLLLAWLVAAGLGGIVATSAVAFTVVKLAGAAYLVVLGWQMWRRRGSLPAALADRATGPGARRIVREGFVVGATNPKTAVFFAAVLPQFVDPDGAAAVWLQMGVLGLVFALVALASDSVWGLLAGTARDWLARRPGRLRAVGGIGSLVVVALGVRLALTGRHD